MALMILVAGCATQKQATDVEDVLKEAQKGGFLPDYSLLTRPEDPLQGMLVWRSNSAPWKTYDKIMIEPVQIWGDALNDTGHQQDLMSLADHARKDFVDAFTKVPWIEVVDKPGPGVVILQIAITNAEANHPTLKAISTVVPFGMVASAVTEAVSDKPSFAGEIQVEAKALDAMTGKVVAMAVDRRVGGRSLKTITNSWRASYDALEAYSHMAVYRLCILREEKNCPVPKI